MDKICGLGKHIYCKERFYSDSFTLGKRYLITYQNETLPYEIGIEDDDGEQVIFNSFAPFSDHFCSEQKYRQMKLKELSKKIKDD